MSFLEGSVIKDTIGQTSTWLAPGSLAQMKGGIHFPPKAIVI
jgi:hypothetical protein